MSRTVNDDCPLTTATFDLQLYEEYAYYFREQLIVVGLLAGLHGTHPQATNNLVRATDHEAAHHQASLPSCPSRQRIL